MATEAALETKAKAMSPPDAVTCCMVDHLNGRTLQNIFERLKAGQDDEMVEKVVHTITAHCRMYDQCLFEAVMPLVAKLGAGKELSKTMKAKLVEAERCLEALDACKKHLGDKEFVAAMQKQKQADIALMEAAETQILPALLEELDNAELVEAAAKMEQIKLKAPLAPQAKAFAA